MATSERLTAAVGRADITPPIGIDLIGFAGRGPSTGMHDPLAATALALGCGESKAAIVACDLIDLEEEQVDEIAALIHQRCGMSPTNVLFCCSHTHYGPRIADEPEDCAAYRKHLTYVLAGLVAEAAGRTVPVRVGVGKGNCDVNINRRERQPDGTIRLGRNPEGFTDRDVIVARIEADAGRPLAALVNYACHGVCLSGQWRLISSDFPGPMRGVVESAVGATALYLQGATGNMNPKLMANEYRSARSTGVKLAGEALKVWESIVPEEATGLAAASLQVELPALRFLSKEKAAGLLERDRKELEQRKKEGAIPNLIRWIERRIEREEAAVRSWETGEPPPGIPDRIHAIRFGPAAVVSSAGEIFAQIGVEVKRRSPIPNTLFAGYTNGDIGYIPVPEAYEEGGYEVTHACRVDPGAASILIDGCLRALERVK
ncbi:MAG: hypothetical protein AB1696_27730 [Planctomycetota bacterium]